MGYQGRERSYLTPERGSANPADQQSSSLMHRSWAQPVLVRDGCRAQPCQFSIVYFTADFPQSLTSSCALGLSKGRWGSCVKERNASQTYSPREPLPGRAGGAGVPWNPLWESLGQFLGPCPWEKRLKQGWKGTLKKFGLCPAALESLPSFAVLYF